MKTNETIIRAKGSPCRFTRSNGNSERETLRWKRMSKHSVLSPAASGPARCGHIPFRRWEEALRIPATIQEAHAGLPFDRVLLAAAVGTTASQQRVYAEAKLLGQVWTDAGGLQRRPNRHHAARRGHRGPQGDRGAERGIDRSAVQPEVFGGFTDVGWKAASRGYVHSEYAPEGNLGFSPSSPQSV